MSDGIARGRLAETRTTLMSTNISRVLIAMTMACLVFLYIWPTQQPFILMTTTTTIDNRHNNETKTDVLTIANQTEDDTMPSIRSTKERQIQSNNKSDVVSSSTWIDDTTTKEKTSISVLTGHYHNLENETQTNLHESSIICKDRLSMIDNAKRWLDADVKYRFHSFFEGYRQQCSGFVSAVWGLKILNPKETPRCYHLEERGFAYVISKEDLRMGDALVCNDKKYKPWKLDKKLKGQQRGGHCLVFEKWTNESEKTHYVGWELCGDATCRDVNRRVIPYPYYYKLNCWEPMRKHNLTC